MSEKRPPLSSFIQKQKEEASDEAVVTKLRGPKGDSGKDAVPPTPEELKALIEPLIPEPIPGKDGKSFSEKELVSLIKPLIPKPIAGKDGIDGVTPSLEELEAIVLPLIPEVEIPELQPKDLIEKINKAKSVKIKRERVEGFDEIEGLAKSANRNVQNILSLGGSRQTAIKVSGTLLGTGINTLNFVGATGVKVGDGSEVNITTSGSGGGGQVNSVVAGTGITVDSTDPANPIVTSTSQAPITLTTTGTSGNATFTSNTLNVPNYTFTLPTASTSVLGGVKIDGTSITISGGVISATTGGSGTVTSVTSADANATVANTTTTPVITIVSAPKWATARNLAGNSVDGSANVAFANKFIVQGTTDAGLSGAQFLGALTTGIVKNTTTTGVFSIAIPADFPTLNQSTTGSAATLTTPRAINGVNFDGSAAITVTAAAGTLTGTTLNSTVVTSSLTTLGTSASLPGSPTTTTQSPADNSTKIATTAYVDAAVLGQNFKEAALVATTANLVGVYLAGVFTYTATGTDNIDGVNLALGNRVLVKNQTTTFQNGIYTVTTAGSLGVAGVLTRSSDANTSAEFKTGDALLVTSGTVNASTTWAYTGVDSPNLGTDAITYVQIAGLGSYVAGNGLTLTGNSFSIDTSITVDKTTAQTLTNKSIVATQLTGTLQAGQFPALTGDITTTAGALATTLATVNTNTGSFTNASITVNGKGLITAASNGTTPVTSVTGTTNRITVTGTTSAVVDIAATYVGQSSITTLGTITAGVWTGTTIAIANGGTGVTSVTTAPVATAFAGWDANKNLSANNFLEGYTTTATAGATTTLVVGSTETQYFTGTNSQTCQLPVTSTLVLGQQFHIVNNSTLLVTVNSSGGNTIVILASGTSATFTVILTTGTTAASWNSEYAGAIAASSAKLTINGVFTVTGTNATTMTFPTTSATIARTDAAQTFTGVQTFSSAPVLSTGTLTNTGTVTFFTSSDTVVGRATTDTLTNKRITPRVVSTTQSATPAINTDNGDIFEITGLAQAITSVTLTGTPVEGQMFELIIKDNGTARAIALGSSFVSSTVTIPTTTVISTPIAMLFQWRSSAVWTATSAFYCIAVA